MYYSVIKNCDIANGPGVRVVLFVSGCRHHCPGCFQPQTWDFSYGQPFTQDTVDELLRLLQPDYIAGLTLLGGVTDSQRYTVTCLLPEGGVLNTRFLLWAIEPENQPVLLELVRQVKQAYPEKNIWCFSGYLYDDLAAGKIGDGAVTRALLSLVDVLVDGEFILARKKLQLRFRGSENQRLIDLRKTEQAGHVVLWTDEKEGEKTCKRSV